MGVPSERSQAWFSLATTLDSADWEVAVEQPEATLSHRSCPFCWGGHLVKFDYNSILVEGTGHLRPSDLLLRPEVRGLFGQSLDGCHAQLGMETVSVFAPGDAVMAQQTNIPILRMCRLLFGESKKSCCTFFYNEKPVLARHQLRRDFPEPGDCTLAWFQEIEGTWQEYLIVCRSNGIHGDDRSYRIVVCFSMPNDTWASWASPFFVSLIKQGQQTLTSYLNRPFVNDLRALDVNFYVVLSLRSFNRGLPLLPDRKGEIQITLPTQEEVHFFHTWTEYQPSAEKFRFAEYMCCFLEKLGYVDEKVYDILDGRLLVPYQCVLQRSRWETLRDVFLPAMNLQKSAYRRARGGTTAPSLQEDVMPRFLPTPSTDVIRLKEAPGTKMVVRRTFLELEEEYAGNIRRIQSECELMKLVMV